MGNNVSIISDKAFDLSEPHDCLSSFMAFAGNSHLWLSRNAGKRWTEVFFLAYSPFWIAWALCILVPFQLYEVDLHIAALPPKLLDPT